MRALDCRVKAQDAATGVLISMDEPTAKMKQWAATYDLYASALIG